MADISFGGSNEVSCHRQMSEFANDSTGSHGLLNVWDSEGRQMSEASSQNCLTTTPKILAGLNVEDTKACF